MLNLLFLGFIIGMRHALEADHFSAIATLTSKGLSMIISIPIRASSERLIWLHNGLQLAIGVCTLGIGASMVVRLA